jgi:hypothetical protein
MAPHLLELNIFIRRIAGKINTNEELLVNEVLQGCC